MDLKLSWPQEEQSEAKHKAIKKSTWISIIVNVFLTCVQVLVGIIAGSQGLIADGIHSLSDLLADFVVLVAAHHSKREADKNHHYGHLRYENAASLVLGILLLLVGFGMTWTAITKLREPSTIAPVQTLALWVALLALFIKEMLFRYMLAVAERVKSSMLIANAWHARSDAASSLVVALGIGGNLLGFPLFDPLAALIVGLMVTKMGFNFSIEAAHDLTDRAANEAEIESIRQEILGTPGIQGVHDLKTRRAGDLLLVDVHLEVDAFLTIKQGHDLAIEARSRVMRNHPVLEIMTHIDPVEKIFEL
jgi:cation diffusion facilitator family transporter